MNINTHTSDSLPVGGSLEVDGKYYKPPSQFIMGLMEMGIIFFSKKPVKGANHRPTSPLRLSVKD